MKFKSVVILALGIVATGLLVACGDEDSGASGTDRLGFENHFSLVSGMDEYGIEGEHRFYEVSMYEALQLRQNDDFDGILLFTFPTCPWCQQAVPIVHEASQLADVDIFYVSRAHDLREGDWLDWDAEMAWWLYEHGVSNMAWIDEEGQVTLSESDDAFRPNISVPQIVHLRSGQVLGNHRGTFDGHDRLEDGTLPALTDQERATLLDVYLNIFSAVNEIEACPLDSTSEDDEGCA